MCEVTCVSEHTTFFILFSSGVSSSETCFISLESFSKFSKHDTHTNELESVIDTVQRGNLWCANSVSTGTTCWEAGLATLRLLGKRRRQALHSGCEAEISLERSGVHTATCAQPLILHFHNATSLSDLPRRNFPYPPQLSSVHGKNTAGS